MKAGTTKKLRNKKQWEVLVIGAGPAGVLAALRAADLGTQTALVTSGAFGGMAAEGGSYRVVVSLTRTVLWLLSGIFDKAYAKATAGSTDEHTYIAPDLFTAETPLGSYQGMRS
jgi:glycine/D-amino acid oxidase-like deaminating enzyme